MGVTVGYYLFNAAPYALTLAIMIVDQLARTRTVEGTPSELAIRAVTDDEDSRPPLRRPRGASA